MNQVSDGTPAVELRGLTRWFRQVLAVNNLTLRVEAGSTYGLIGPNGAGKTTTIRMLMGLLTPTDGEALVLGRDARSEPLMIKQRVGYVPESHHMDRWMRVGEVVRFCRAQYDRWNDATCRDLLRLFELDEAKRVKHLSRGMLTKLSLVLAVAHEPDLLVLDEPLAGLDPFAREEFLDGVLRAICERERTVLISTHSLDDIQRLADTVGMLYGGRMLVQSNIDALAASTKRLRVVLRDGHQPPPLPDHAICHRHEGREWLVTVSEFTPAVAQQVRAGPGVEHVEVIDLGLEDLFKDYVRGRRAAK